MKKQSKFIFFLAALLLSFGLGFSFAKYFPFENTRPKKVTGIGVIFFQCKDPKTLKEWYSKHLGLNTDKYGTVFVWYQGADSTRNGYTQWSPFSEKTKYFDPSTKDFMINYRVEDLESLVAQLRTDSVSFLDTIETYDYGKFVHIMDLEGNKIELWEPYDEVYGKIEGATTK
jgi:predicted enzyme related to lactoylglutathione lyase